MDGYLTIIPVFHYSAIPIFHSVINLIFHPEHQGVAEQKENRLPRASLWEKRFL
jgi:hypothetical protein